MERYKRLLSITYQGGADEYHCISQLEDDQRTDPQNKHNLHDMIIAFDNRSSNVIGFVEIGLTPIQLNYDTLISRQVSDELNSSTDKKDSTVISKSFGKKRVLQIGMSIHETPYFLYTKE